MQVIFCYYGVDKTTGNKKKFQFCFLHAMEEVVKTGTRIEVEIVGDDVDTACDVCYGGK